MDPAAVRRELAVHVVTEGPQQCWDAIIGRLRAGGVEWAVGLPDDWLAGLIKHCRATGFRYLPVARETEAFGVAAGAFLGGSPVVAFMGIAGLFTAVHEMTTLNIAHGLPTFVLSSLRGTAEDMRTYQVAQGRYGRPLLECLGITYEIVSHADDLWKVENGYARARLLKGPYVVFLTKAMLGAVPASDRSTS